MSRRWLVVVLVAIAAWAAAVGSAAGSSGSIPATLNGVAPFGKGVLAVGADQQFFGTSPSSGLPLSETLSHGRFKALKTGPAHQLVTMIDVARASARRAYAVGYESRSDGTIHTAIYRLDGKRWTPMFAPSPGRNAILDAVTVARGAVWAFGQSQADDFAPKQTLILRLTGGAWLAAPSPNPSSLAQNLYAATADAAGNVWAVGYYQDPDDFSFHAFSVVNRGSGFVQVDTPSPGGANGTKLQGIARAGSRLVAVGNYYDATPRQQTLAEVWDGSAWSVVTSASPGSVANVLAGVAVAHGVPWAVGHFADGSCDRTLTERLTGGAFTAVASPNAGGCSVSSGASNVLDDVAADSHGTLYAVGAADTRTLVLRRTGNAWKRVRSAN